MRVKVLKTGVWDLLHVGHVRALEASKRAGDLLVVGVQSDAVAMKTKGRVPVIPLFHRIEMLSSLSCVDSVVTIHNQDYVKLMQLWGIHVYALEENCPMAPRHIAALAYAEEKGIKVVRIPCTTDVSTTLIRESVVC